MGEAFQENQESISPEVLKAVIWNKLLWTAGYSLTTGGFLLYFAKELQATAFQIALILVIPETVGSIAVLSRRLINFFQSRKKTWLVLSIFSRIVSIGIPLSALPLFHSEPDYLYTFFLPPWFSVRC